MQNLPPLKKEMMKNLLVLTDFSDTAFRAAEYACMLSKEYNCEKIILFHAYQSYISGTDVPISPIQEPELLQKLNIALDELKIKLQAITSPSMSVTYRKEEMELAEGINTICGEERIDLVLMGTTGKSKMEQIFRGSNAVTVSKVCMYPLCIIPENAVLEPIKNILLATDLVKVDSTNRLSDLLSILGVKVFAVNIDPNNQHFNNPATEELQQLHRILDQYNAEYFFVKEIDTAGTIIRFAEENKISLIIAMPKERGFLESLFHQSTSGKLIYNTTIPILTLHE